MAWPRVKNDFGEVECFLAFSRLCSSRPTQSGQEEGNVSEVSVLALQAKETARVDVLETSKGRSMDKSVPLTHVKDKFVTQVFVQT